MVFVFKRWTAVLVAWVLIGGIYLIVKVGFLTDTNETQGMVIVHKGETPDYEPLRGAEHLVMFKLGNDTVCFSQQTIDDYYDGQPVNVVYKRNNPAKAIVYSFREYWLFDTFWCGLPMMMMSSLILGGVKRDEILVVQPFSFLIRVVKGV